MTKKNEETCSSEDNKDSRNKRLDQADGSLVIRKNNNHKKRSYGFFASALFVGAISCLGYAGMNAWSMHTWDKYVIKQVEIAANVPSAGRSSKSGPDDISMESALDAARKNLDVSRLDNPAIIWQTPLTDVPTLDLVLYKATTRANQIQAFKDSFDSGVVQKNAPDWVHEAFDTLHIKNIVAKLTVEKRNSLEDILPSIEYLANSELGQRIGSEYESLNSVVAGGTRLSAKNLKERHRSLLDTLNTAAGWRSVIRLQGDDYKQAHAHVFVGYLMANMGYLSEGLDHFGEAKKLMNQYDDDHNLAIIRNTPELSQKTIKGLINSSINELSALNNDPNKYSTGWWKRLRFYNQSIGGQSNPSIQDMGEAINSRYNDRAMYSGILGLFCLFVGGRVAKKLRAAKKYEVKYE